MTVINQEDITQVFVGSTEMDEMWMDGYKIYPLSAAAEHELVVLSARAEDIPASGGSVNSCLVVFTFDGVQRSQYVDFDDVYAEKLPDVVSDRALISTVPIAVEFAGVAKSATVDVYQAANSFDYEIVEVAPAQTGLVRYTDMDASLSYGNVGADGSEAAPQVYYTVSKKTYNLTAIVRTDTVWANGNTYAGTPTGGAEVTVKNETVTSGATLSYSIQGTSLHNAKVNANGYVSASSLYGNPWSEGRIATVKLVISGLGDDETVYADVSQAENKIVSTTTHTLSSITGTTEKAYKNFYVYLSYGYVGADGSAASPSVRYTIEEYTTDYTIPRYYDTYTWSSGYEDDSDVYSGSIIYGKENSTTLSGTGSDTGKATISFSGSAIDTSASMNAYGAVSAKHRHKDPYSSSIVYSAKVSASWHGLSDSDTAYVYQESNTRSESRETLTAAQSGLTRYPSASASLSYGDVGANGSSASPVLSYSVTKETYNIAATYRYKYTWTSGDTDYSDTYGGGETVTNKQTYTSGASVSWSMSDKKNGASVSSSGVVSADNLKTNDWSYGAIGTVKASLTVGGYDMAATATVYQEANTKVFSGYEEREIAGSGSTTTKTEDIISITEFSYSDIGASGGSSSAPTLHYNVFTRTTTTKKDSDYYEIPLYKFTSGSEWLDEDNKNRVTGATNTPATIDGAKKYDTGCTVEYYKDGYWTGSVNYRTGVISSIPKKGTSGTGLSDTTVATVEVTVYTSTDEVTQTATLTQSANRVESTERGTTVNSWSLVLRDGAGNAVSDVAAAGGTYFACTYAEYDNYNVYTTGDKVKSGTVSEIISPTFSYDGTVITGVGSSTSYCGGYYGYPTSVAKNESSARSGSVTARFNSTNKTAYVSQAAGAKPKTALESLDVTATVVTGGNYPTGYMYDVTVKNTSSKRIKFYYYYKTSPSSSGIEGGPVYIDAGDTWSSRLPWQQLKSAEFV